MEITENISKEFTPIIITLKTQEELTDLTAYLGKATSREKILCQLYWELLQLGRTKE